MASGAEDARGESSSKRRRQSNAVVSTACTTCRRKRTKCDGNTPCQKCSGPSAPECVYEVNTRILKQHMRREIIDLRQENVLHTSIMQALAAEQDVSVILEGLRNHDDLMTIVQKIHPNSASASEASPSASTSDSMQSSTEGSSAPSTQSTAPMIGNEKRHDESGYSKLQDLNPIREISTRAQRQKACRWHTILADDLLVKQLVSIYWIWIHPVHPILDMQDFILDYDKGVGEHCSTFLVHAMCLAACDLLSPSWEHIPGQDTDVVALQQHLMVRAQADAQAALAEGSDASTTTAQALAIMSVVKTLLGEGDSSRVEDAALEPHSAVLRLRRTEAEAPF